MYTEFIDKSTYKRPNAQPVKSPKTRSKSKRKKRIYTLSKDNYLVQHENPLLPKIKSFSGQIASVLNAVIYQGYEKWWPTLFKKVQYDLYGIWSKNIVVNDAESMQNYETFAKALAKYSSNNLTYEHFTKDSLTIPLPDKWDTDWAQVTKFMAKKGLLTIIPKTETIGLKLYQILSNKYETTYAAFSVGKTQNQSTFVDSLRKKKMQFLLLLEYVLCISFEFNCITRFKSHCIIRFE